MRVLLVTLVVALISLVYANAAEAGHARHCAQSIKAHHTTCRVAKRVVGKWSARDFTTKTIRAAGQRWQCSFTHGTREFNCFSFGSARISGEISKD